MTPQRYGAEESHWAHFDVILGLHQDLLPVVSRPDVPISPASGLKALGKVPSTLNRKGEAVGFAKWPDHVATDADVARWSKNPDYGICVITRDVRAIDADITDPTLAKEIHDEIDSFLGRLLPCRYREGASKFLLCFRLPGSLPKRIIATAHGNIECLGSGQQFVASGLHPSGTRYSWIGGLPNHIPELAPEVFEALWARLLARFGTGSSSEKVSTKAETLDTAVSNDPVAQELIAQGATVDRDGKLRLSECPFADGHTPGGDDSIVYFPASTGGYSQGNFRCLHASCAEHSQRDFQEALGIREPEGDPRDDFEAIVFDGPTENGVAKAVRYAFAKGLDFSAGEPMGWIIKGVLPRGELGVIYGPPASGKSFFALDMVFAIAKGEPWCGKRVRRGRVGYVAAEGAGGFRNRIQAYEEEIGIEPEDDILVLSAVPNLLQKQDVVDLGNAIRAVGGLDVLVYDTMARGTVGGDENSAQDMGLAIANCRTLHDVTGAMIILIHHSGKDPSKGARGSNAILGAVDVEIEISRQDNNRTAKVSKLKDGEDGQEYGFTLKTVPIGMDEDGDVVSSCVVEHCAVAPRRAVEKKLGAREEALLHTFNRMSDDLAGKVLTIREVCEAAAEEYNSRPNNMLSSMYALERRGLLDLSSGTYVTKGVGK